MRDGDFATLLESAVAHSWTALDKTQEQLDVLRKAGVVDAGAKGFVVLIDGMYRHLIHGEVAEEPDLSVLHADEAAVAMAGSDEDSTFPAAAAPR